MKKFIIGAIRVYQKTISPDHGIFFSWRRKKTCRFYPTCSEYTARAIEKYGIMRGAGMATKRIVRCTPSGGAEIDEP